MNKIIIGLDGSNEIEFGRKSLQFGEYSKKPKMFNVSDKVYNAIRDAYTGDLSPEKAYKIASNEIEDFYLDGVIIMSDAPSKKPISKPIIKSKPKSKNNKKAIRKLPLNRDSPVKVPFNVNLNEGIEGECVKRIIKPKKNSIYPNSKKDYTGKTVDDLIKYCDDTKRSLKLYDITGKVFHKSEYPYKKNYPSITALIHGQHIYDCETKHIKINGNVTYDDPEDGYLYYKKGNYVITSGVHKQKDIEAYVETTFPTCSFDEAIATTLKESILALAYYNDLQTQEPKYTIDCNKCYYSTATEPGYITRYGLFSIFDTFKPYTKQAINEYSFYQIHSPESYKYGIQTNFVGGRTLLALKNLNVPVRILKVLTPYKTQLWEHRQVKELFTDHKKFNVFNGMCGRIDCFYSTEIEIEDPQEREYILEDHPDFSLNPNKPNIITNTTLFTKINSHLHRYLTVVDAANARVLRTLKEINLPCIKIKTDSLTFITNPILPQGWKYENYKPSNTTTSDHICKSKIQSIKYERNICILGPPGTGKSHLVKNEYKYDYAAAYTNKSALNCSTPEIQGQTLHVLFNLLSTKSLCHLRDKTVWIDEISMIPRWVWGYIIEAYLNFDTTFIFSGDFNQTTPVNEESLFEIPFLGEIKRLTKDYRNDQEVINLRESILNDTFNTNSIIYATELPLCNIAYTNEKVKQVNNMIVEKYNFVWGSKDTKVIANSTIKGLGIAKNQSYILTNDFEITINNNPIKIEEDIFDKIFEWGYCYTVHKSQGDTIKEDLGIHEFKKYNKSIMYTAVTRVCNYQQLKFFG